MILLSQEGPGAVAVRGARAPAPRVAQGVYDRVLFEVGGRTSAVTQQLDNRRGRAVAALDPDDLGWEPALVEKIGPAVLVTHSHSGGMGWRVASQTRKVRAIVSYEPGSGFIFPQDEVPAPVPMAGGALAAAGAPLPEFLPLTKIPIVIYYGDNIPAEQIANPGQDGWRARLVMARRWRDVVNRHGGDVTVVHLPEIGLRGNAHFPFSDLNNVEVANVMSEFLRTKELD